MRSPGFAQASPLARALSSRVRVRIVARRVRCIASVTGGTRRAGPNRPHRRLPYRARNPPMNAPLCKTALALGFLIVSPAAFAETDADVQAKLVALTQELMDALVPGKADAWQRILADNAIVI